MISLRSHIPSTAKTPLARAMYAAVTAPPTTHKPDRYGPVQTIAWEEAARAGITYAQIIGDQRQRKFVEARHQAIWRASNETTASLNAIGRVFGHRDHSTIMYAIRKVEARHKAAVNDNASDSNEGHANG